VSADDEGAAADPPADRLLAAKRPTSRLTGPYGHPLHPALVPIPIGAWTASFAFDLASRYANDGAVYARGAFWLIVIGIAGAVAAGVVGTIDLLGVARRTRAFRTGITHLLLNDVILVPFLVSAVVRRGETSTEPTELPLLGMSAVALVLLLVSGWLGGELAYRYGVRTAAEEHQVEAYEEGTG